MLYDGQILDAPVKQLSIVTPSKKRVHGELQRQIQVWPPSALQQQQQQQQQKSFLSFTR